MKTIDTKSFLIGTIATALIMVTVGAIGRPSSEIGRYQEVNWDKGIYHILDTSTGQTWGSTGQEPIGKQPDWYKVMNPVK